MTYNDMLRIAMEQSAEDLGCKADDFTKTCNVIVPYNLGKNVRKYLKLPITANLYLPSWSNALCEKRKELDVLGVGAYDGATTLIKS